MLPSDPLTVQAAPESILQHQVWDEKCFNRMIEACAGIGAMGQGLHHANIETVLYNDINSKFCDWVMKLGKPVVQGHIGHDSTIQQIFQTVQGPSILSGGVACQPYSPLGDQKEHLDSRADSLPGLLKAGFLMASPIIAIECVCEAQTARHASECIAQFQFLTGYIRIDKNLHLLQVWPSRRTRWWCILCAPSLGVRSIPDLPTLSIQPVACDLLPHFPVWPEQDEQQTELDLYDLRTFQDFGGRQQTIHPNKVVATALHSWGSQAKACLCGCRSGGFL